MTNCTRKQEAVRKFCYLRICFPLRGWHVFQKRKHEPYSFPKKVIYALPLFFSPSDSDVTYTTKEEFALSLALEPNSNLLTWTLHPLFYLPPSSWPRRTPCTCSDCTVWSRSNRTWRLWQDLFRCSFLGSLGTLPVQHLQTGSYIRDLAPNPRTIMEVMWFS